jgi:hypothetical protein
MHCRGSKNVTKYRMLIAGICLDRRPLGVLLCIMPHGIQQVRHVQNKNL